MRHESDNFITSNDREIYHTCSILESIAQQFDSASPEHQAIEDAAVAFILVHQHKSLLSAYRKLKSTVSDELDAEIIDKLRDMGINPDELDNDNLQ
ncbi:MAG: hypothetical protein O2955_03150 [Planctomycetota bacterium]|nr:hypothetical protein [Planctomycetota bacterium]MDA1211485.1 hypothetical protein [Planctomycetota bacterium]